MADDGVALRMHHFAVSFGTSVDFRRSLMRLWSMQSDARPWRAIVWSSSQAVVMHSRSSNGIQHRRRLRQTSTGTTYQTFAMRSESTPTHVTKRTWHALEARHDPSQPAAIGGHSSFKQLYKHPSRRTPISESSTSDTLLPSSSRSPSVGR